MPNFSDNNIVPIVLMKIYCEDDTIRYATFNTSTTEGAYLESLVSSTVSRKFDILGYSFESNRASINVQNADEKFIRLLSEKSLYGRKVELFAGIKGQNLEEMALAFTGKVQDRGTSNGNGSISFYDVRPNLPNVPKNPLTKSDFGDLPSGSGSSKVGLLSGKISASDNSGRLNLIRVSSSEYIVCVGRAIAVDDVYLDGVKKTKGDTNDYIVKHANYGEKIGFHVLVKFNSGKEPSDSAVVTADVRGMGYDYVKLKGWKPVVESSQYIIDSYGLSINGSDELVWKDGGIWTTNTSFTIQVNVKPASFSGDRTIFCQEHLEEGGAKGFRLYVGSDQKVRLSISKTDHNNVNTLISNTTISSAAYTKIKVSYDISTKIAKMYFDTGSGFVLVASATFPDSEPLAIWKKAAIGAVWKNYPDPALWIQHFHGIIDYVKFAQSAQLNTNEITAVNHAWLLEQNLNDSVGSYHMTGINIDAANYVEVSGHYTEAIDQQFYPYIGSETPDSSDWNWSTSKAVTLAWRIRTPVDVEWVAGESTTHTWNFMFYQQNSLWVLYYPSLKLFHVRIRNAADTDWISICSAYLDEPLVETNNQWKLIVFSTDLEEGKSKLFVNGQLIYSQTFTPAAFHVLNSVGNYWIRYLGGPYLGPSECDVDYLAIATVYVGDRRVPFPAENEINGFWDWNINEKDSGVFSPCTCGSNTRLRIGVGTTNGYTGTVAEGSSHSYQLALNKPAEDIRDLLHYIDEPIDHNSVLAAISAHNSIIGNTDDQNNKSLNDIGQWGSVISGSARELIRDLTLNCDTQIFQKPDSTWFLKYIDFNTAASGGDSYSYLDNIDKEYWDLSFQSNLKNNRRVEWCENLSGIDGDEYLGGAKAQIIESKIRLGQWYYDQPLKLARIRGPETAKAIGLSVLRKQASEIPKIAFKTNLKPVERLISGNDLGETIVVSHPNGVGDQEQWGLRFDGTGVDRIFGKNAAWPGSTSFTIQIRGAKLSTAKSCWYGKGDEDNNSKRNFIVYFNNDIKRLTVGICDGTSWVYSAVFADTYTNLGDEVVVKVTYDLASKAVKSYQGPDENDLVDVHSWNTGMTLNSYDALEGIGSLVAGSSSYPTCDRIDYVKIAYSFQDNAEPIVNPVITFHPSKNGAPYISEERNLLMTPQSTKEPLPVKWQNAGFDRQPCAIEGITYNFLQGQSTVNAVALGFLQSGGEFILDTLDPGEEGEGGGGVDPPDPEPEYEYYSIPFNCSLKWIYSGGGTITPGEVWHGTDIDEYLMRGQMKADINNFTEELLSADLEFNVHTVVTPRENIEIYNRTDVSELASPDWDAGLNDFYGSIGNGVGSKVVPLNGTALSHIEAEKGSSLIFGMQGTNSTPVNKWYIDSAKLVLHVRRSI